MDRDTVHRLTVPGAFCACDPETDERITDPLQPIANPPAIMPSYDLGNVVRRRPRENHHPELQHKKGLAVKPGRQPGLMAQPVPARHEGDLRPAMVLADGVDPVENN